MNTTNYQTIKRQIQEKALACGRKPESIEWIVVTKGRAINEIEAVYAEGGRMFGESRLQEAAKKMQQLPSECQWHFIGTLQSNKIAKVIPHFQLIHSVDTLELAANVAEESKKQGIITSILLQVNVTGESSKHGLSSDEWESSLDAVNQLSHLRIEGLMTIGPHTENKTQIRDSFRKLYQLREEWCKKMRDPHIFQHLSMGMSNDFLLAIEEGATLLRIGSALFFPLEAEGE